MLKQFKVIETPFVLDPYVEKRPYVAHPFSGKEEDVDDYYNTNYCEPNLYQRLIWIRRRGSVLAMFEKLSRIQTRRIARSTAEIRM